MSNPVIRIRQAPTTAMPALAELQHSAFSPVGAQSWSADDLATLAGADQVTTRLADFVPSRSDAKNTEPIGFVMGRAAQDEGEIITLCVDQRWRRHGVGAALMGSLLFGLRVRAENLSKLFLEVAADNGGATSFYSRLGFSEVGRRKDYYIRTIPGAARGRIDAIVMAKKLD